MVDTTKISISEQIPEELKGSRFDAAVSKIFTDYSRERLKSWILKGECTLNGKKLKPKEKVNGGEIVAINSEIENAVSWNAEELANIELEYVHIDEDIVVINKPKGLVVHPGAGNTQGTLVNVLLNKYPELEKLPRAGIVHRLDKDTSGLMVVARSIAAHTSLVAQLQERTVNRTYDAIVWGLKPAGTTINAPIDRHKRERVKMAVVEGGKEAITHFKVAEKFRNNMHVKVNLETGRTHQIRVHMTHINHPLVGDRTYGRQRNLSRATPDLREFLQSFSRQALHACKLGLNHPKTNERVEWQADMPQDMQGLIVALRKDFEESTK